MLEGPLRVSLSRCLYGWMDRWVDGGIDGGCSSNKKVNVM